ncbi:hypothetical protein AB1N83_011672 [Pleurotus pulmonarius]
MSAEPVDHRRRQAKRAIDKQTNETTNGSLVSSPIPDPPNGNVTESSATQHNAIATVTLSYLPVHLRPSTSSTAPPHRRWECTCDEGAVSVERNERTNETISRPPTISLRPCNQINQPTPNAHIAYRISHSASRLPTPRPVPMNVGGHGWRRKRGASDPGCRIRCSFSFVRSLFVFLPLPSQRHEPSTPTTATTTQIRSAHPLVGSPVVR